MKFPQIAVKRLETENTWASAECKDSHESFMGFKFPFGAVDDKSLQSQEAFVEQTE